MLYLPTIYNLIDFFGYNRGALRPWIDLAWTAIVYLALITFSFALMLMVTTVIPAVIRFGIRQDFSNTTPPDTRIARQILTLWLLALLAILEWHYFLIGGTALAVLSTLINIYLPASIIQKIVNHLPKHKSF